MDTLLTGVVGLVVGATLGFYFRSWEFRREQRLKVYGEYVAAFMAVTRNGAGLASLFFTWGDKLFTEKADLWSEARRSWAVVLFDYEDASARLRLVASRGVQARADELDTFVTQNIKRTPPLWPGAERDTSGWGEAAKVGPAKIESEGMRLGHAFAELAGRDVVFRPRRP